MGGFLGTKSTEEGFIEYYGGMPIVSVFPSSIMLS